MTYEATARAQAIVEDDATIAAALRALRRYRDQGCPELPPRPPALVRELMGEHLPRLPSRLAVPPVLVLVRAERRLACVLLHAGRPARLLPQSRGQAPAARAHPLRRHRRGAGVGRRRQAVARARTRRGRRRAAARRQRRDQRGWTAEPAAVLQPMRATGRGGLDLNDHWAGDARAYLGLTVPAFHNLFLLYGPNTNIVVNGSIIFFSECSVRHVLGCIELLLRGDHRAMEVRAAPHDRHNAAVDAQNVRMAWGAEGVRGWYESGSGRASQNWPFPLVDYWQATRAPNPDDFELR